MESSVSTLSRAYLHDHLFPCLTLQAALKRSDFIYPVVVESKKTQTCVIILKITVIQIAC